jgi:hypothetical protein
MKSNVFFLFIFSLLFVVAGCEQYPATDDFDGGDYVVTVSFKSHALSSSLLKSDATSEEDSILKVILYAVDENDTIVKQYEYAGVNGVLPNNIDLTVSRKVEWLYAVANPSIGIELGSPSNLDDLMDMTGNFLNAAPHSPFLMSGKGEISPNSPAVTINLIRMVARIDFVGKNGFQIDSIAVENAPGAGYVFQRASLSVPASAQVNYSAGTDTTLYVAESLSANPTRFVVTGTVQGQALNNPLTITLLSGENEIDILRNTRYQVVITPVPGAECDITTIIPGWNDGDTTKVSVPEPKPLNPYENGIKILAIGNSYSRNAMQHMCDLLLQLRDENTFDRNRIKIVNAYIGGGFLAQHAQNARNNVDSAYVRQHFLTAGGQVWPPDTCALQQLIEEDEWDVIMLQQFSRDSGRPGTYNADLDDLIDYVHNHATNPNVKLGWHMTWAYTDDYANADYGLYYGGNQGNMYAAICNAVETMIAPKTKKPLDPASGGDFDFIVPVGTAIQNARVYFGDNLNADGTHLNGLGCYVAAVTWIETIMGQWYDITNLDDSYTVPVVQGAYPAYPIDANAFGEIVKAVKAAKSSPF